MKSLVQFFVSATVLALPALVVAQTPSAQDAYGYCYHFFDCSGLRFPGGYFSASDCSQMGGLSVQEGSYCENLPESDSSSLRKTANPLWFGECYFSFNCVGVAL